MTITSTHFEALGAGKRVSRMTVNGPSQYKQTTKFEVIAPGKVTWAQVTLRNKPTGNEIIEYTWSGSTIKITFSTISANTSTGAISKTEVADNTDLSGLILDILAEHE